MLKPNVIWLASVNARKYAQDIVEAYGALVILTKHPLYPVNLPDTELRAAWAQATYPRELQERAVHLVFEQEAQYESQWAAIEAIAPKFGCTTETLRRWVRQVGRDQGQREGMTSPERAQLKELERENRELRHANEILRKASAFVAKQNSTADANDTGERTKHRR